MNKPRVGKRKRVVLGTGYLVGSSGCYALGVDTAGIKIHSTRRGVEQMIARRQLVRLVVEILPAKEKKKHE